MKIKLNEKDIVPRQSTKNKLAEFARIHQIFACDEHGSEVVLPIKDSEHVRIQVSNTHGPRYSYSSKLILSQEDYKRFKQSYGLTENNLIGRPVFAVYNSDSQLSLTGLVAIGRDTKIDLGSKSS
jgi:hypothetical protein